ncbi:MAG: hydrogenase maturation protease [Melioribacteraceae bacterium]|nr:hydrogenase maturation protease [Melioribacteraceae bacterium]
MSKTLILGMGNKYFGDDGVGIIIVEKLSSLLKNHTNIKVEETNWGGFRIIDLLSGYDRAIVIDAICTGKAELGHIHRYDYKDLIKSPRMVSFHDINFATAVEFARELEIPMPDDISVYAVEIEESNTFSEVLTHKVQLSIEKCVALIMTDLGFHRTINSDYSGLYCEKLEEIKC